jgi:hypothetical protein
MITENSIFTLEIPNWVNKVRIGTVPTLFYTKGESLPSIHEGATLRKIGNKEYYVDSKNKKIIKNPLQKGSPEYWNLNGQSFYSNNITIGILLPMYRTNLKSLSLPFYHTP